MKAKERPRGLHQIALVALFTLGNTLLHFPWTSAQAGVTISFLLSSVTALLFGLGSSFFAVRFFRRPLWKKEKLRMVLCVLLAAAVCALAFLFAVRATRDLRSFFEGTLLPHGTGLVFAALFLAVCAWLSRGPRRGMDVFALIAFFSALAAVGVLFLLSIPQFHAEYGNIELPSAKAVGASVFPAFAEFALPMFPLGVYLALAKPGRGKMRPQRPLAAGILTGGAMMLLCVLQTLLTFGESYAASLQYPYSAAVRVVSVGAYAFRPELFSYLLDFSACLVRVSVCFSCLKFSVGRFLPRFRNRVPLLAALFAFVALCIF